RRAEPAVAGAVRPPARRGARGTARPPRPAGRATSLRRGTQQPGNGRAGTAGDPGGHAAQPQPAGTGEEAGTAPGPRASRTELSTRHSARLAGSYASGAAPRSTEKSCHRSDLGFAV